MVPAPPHDARPGAALVVLAAGDGRRLGHDTNKVLLPLAGRRVFTYSVQWTRDLPDLRRVLVVVRERDREVVEATVRRELADLRVPVDVIGGGSSRHGSEWEALQELRPAIEAEEVDVVVIHDAARPLAHGDLFSDVIDAARAHGGALPVCEQPALVPLDPGAPETRRTVAVQTPQAFRARPLLAAYAEADRDGFVGTDTASCVERYTDLDVRCVPGDAGNVKITFPEDLFLAERLLARAGWDLTARRRTPGGRARKEGHR